MPKQDTFFKRLGEAVFESSISVERIVWLSVMREHDESWEYLQDNVLNADEKELKEIFGKNLGSLVQEMCDSGDNPLYELAERGGWLICVACRPPIYGQAQGWMLAPYQTTKVIYSSSFTTVMCKALLWEHRIKRQAIAGTKRKQS